MDNIANTVGESPEATYMLYQGEVKSRDIFTDLDKGYTHFFQAHLQSPIKSIRHYDFSLTLLPRSYYALPVVEFINYYLKKYKRKSLSSMSLTALHEAISNSLLWGLLKIKRPENWLDFGGVIEEKLRQLEGSQKTLSIAITGHRETTIHIINPYDTTFDLNKFKADDPRFPRGFDLMRLFSEIAYHEKERTLCLTFKGNKDVFETVRQSQ